MQIEWGKFLPPATPVAALRVFSRSSTPLRITSVVCQCLVFLCVSLSLYSPISFSAISLCDKRFYFFLCKLKYVENKLSLIQFYLVCYIYFFFINQDTSLFYMRPVDWCLCMRFLRKYVLIITVFYCMLFHLCSTICI